jgi:hypothetical protein
MMCMVTTSTRKASMLEFYANGHSGEIPIWFILTWRTVAIDWKCLETWHYEDNCLYFKFLYFKFLEWFLNILDTSNDAHLCQPRKGICRYFGVSERASRWLRLGSKDAASTRH